MNLRKLQNQFIDSLYGQNNPELLTKIKIGKMPKEDLVDIYRNNLFVTLRNALKITYPKSYKKFRKTNEQFIKNNRSRSGNLDDYGEGFADKLEWLQHLSYLASNHKPLNLEKLKKLPPQKLFALKFSLHPSCFLYKNFVIHRTNLEVRIEKISRQEMNFLRGIKADLSLYEIYEKHQIDLQICLQKYLANGVIADFR